MELNSVHNTDGIQLLENILSDFGEKSIHMFLCDLPYSHEGRKITANHWDIPIDIDKFFSLTSQLLTDTGTIVLTATNPFSSYLITKGLPLYKYEWVWEKDNGSNFVHVKHQPFRVHENILVFGKAPTTYNKSEKYMTYNPQFTEGNPYKKTNCHGNVANLSSFKGRNNVDNFGTRYPRSVQKFNLERGLHPTQKPVSLFEYLIKTHSNENEIVVDICAGSGTTAIAAIKSNRKYIVNDINLEYFTIIKTRILESKVNTLSYFE